MARLDRLLESDDFVKPAICMEGSLSLGEVEDRAVSASTLELTRQGEGDTVVEGQAKGLVDILAALALEEVVLQVIAESEELRQLIDERRVLF